MNVGRSEWTNVSTQPRNFTRRFYILLSASITCNDMGFDVAGANYARLGDNQASALRLLWLSCQLYMFTFRCHLYMFIFGRGVDMARLARLQVGDSGDELPDLDQVLGRCIGSIPETPSRPKRKEQQPSPRKQAREQDQKDAVSTILGDGVSKERETLEQARPQSVATRSKPLQPIEANILRYKEQANISLPGRKVSLETSVPRGFLGIRSSPKRVAKTPINYAWAATGVTDDESSATDDDEPFTDLSGFIVSDSESVHDYEDRSSHYSQTKKKSWQGGSHRKAPGKSRLPDQSSGTGRGLTDFIDLISPKRHVSDSQKSATSDEDGTRAEKQEKTKSDTLGGLEDHLAVLRL